jgi:restriction system protein
VLSAFEDAGCLILRNRRYTSDGGIDGRLWWPGCGWRTVALQCKRYAIAIALAHVGACSPRSSRAANTNPPARRPV